ncbi:exodeoxyribonuclease V subunit gamma [Gallaecimonas sp. GXIMD1310]|uniref:exodeoxyribonuclease V subunit gamma n=1 Tax=Gallaecimonas sp. GXIMD1310 TaxID=3131926 RepID=UPI003247CA15
METGLAIIQGNKLDDLRDLLVQYLTANPPPPLQNETFLVQSNGMAQWLKLGLAEATGICAATAMQMPARFLWQAYRAVLGSEQVPRHSPFDKPRLRWRLLRLLPTLTKEPVFAPLERFMADDEDGRKTWQLAQKLADIFDQYQMYRADWLADWEAGHDRLRRPNGEPVALTEPWQAELWRRLQADVSCHQQQLSRSALHQQFLAAANALTALPDDLPKRLIVFGISSLPSQVLDALDALSQHMQVLLFVANPCRHFWGDIVDGRELLRLEQKRQQRKPGLPAILDDDALHSTANPLLAAWGKQGRDYIGLLSRYDEPDHYRQHFQQIDLFSDYSATVLGQLQQDILDLNPLPDTPRSNQDDSIRLISAHSRQREVEILQDFLLTQLERGLRPRDIIVMTPDIQGYAPHIDAVFGQLDRQDPRFIPYTLSDRSEREINPLLQALDKLLTLPQWRFTVSDLADLLDVAAVRARFELNDSDLPGLKNWISGAGIRWGLNGQQRQSLGLPALEQNSWQFGMQRWLLGYAQGAQGAFAGIEPYDEVAGLAAGAAGSLADLLATLEHFWQQLRQLHSPEQWAPLLRELLAGLFMAQSADDRLTLEQLTQALDSWQEHCQEAAFATPVPLHLVRDAWLGALDDGGLAQRFLAGSVNFATLMPMRAIPFRQVCILGLNDGDYPRSVAPVDFDLMAQPGQYRPGDRSRREDDRYLFLEAILSARDGLYLSWIGASVQDNSERPPSVLLGQLQDYLQSGWQQPPTVQQHPLQPFSRRYFEGGDLYSYAGEWRQVLTPPKNNDSAPLVALASKPEADIALLARLLKSPCQLFFNERLKVYLDPQQDVLADDEPFTLSGLEHYSVAERLMNAALESDTALTAQLRYLQGSGELPMAAFAKPLIKQLQETTATLADDARALLASYPHTTTTELAGPGFADWLTLRHNDQGQYLHWQLRPTALLHQGKLRYHALLRLWAAHLLANSRNLAVSSVMLAPDKTLTLAAGSADAQPLLASFHAALDGPLPVSPKAAFAYLSNRQKGTDSALAAAEKAYDGSAFSTGERHTDPYSARAYPCFADMDSEQFMILAERLYGPLWEAAQ